MMSTAIPGDWAGSPLSTLHPSMEVPPARAAEPIVVVGVSGSPASARALRWAADEADRLRARLHVVLIWNVEPRAYYAPAINADEYDRRQERAVTGLAATVHAVADGVPPDRLTMDVAQGEPERDLVARSAGADLLVLGSASGILSDRSIGPVIRACLSSAHCPVVVVGPEGPTSHARHRGTDRQPALAGATQAKAAVEPDRSTP